MKSSFLILSLIILALEFYVYQAVKTILRNEQLRIAYIVLTGLVYAYFFYSFFNLEKNSVNIQRLHKVSTIFIVFMLPKLFIVAFLLIDDLFRFLGFSIKKINGSYEYYPTRRKFLSYLGIGCFSFLSLFLLDGVMFGKYRHWVRRVKIKIPNLGKSFKGYKIVQISDVHSGSFESPEKLQKAIDLINAQEPDLVLFTGDMVNNRASEFEPFIQLFKSIKAKDGKFSILGNHDYGSYVEWSNDEAKAENLSQLIKFQEQAGFRMLRNENTFIEKSGEKLYLVGVENWGEPPFPQYGDLDKATESLPTEAPKILMSHDPTHFDHIVKHHPSNIFLTLSGHTHGMQFGLDLKNIKWSPAKYRYPKWADLYQSNGKYLYVNRGFGVLGYPGRAGIYPEITLLLLQ